jgi:hypothetical protein
MPCIGHSQTGRTRSQAFLLGCLVLLVAIASSCKPFNVKPRIEVPRAANEARTDTNGVVISASVVRDEDWLTDTFDANLILAGIVPVRVELKNAGQTPIELSKARFELKIGSGQSFGSVNHDRAYKRALAYYDLSAWSKALYKESRADFASYALDTKSPAAPGESRQGLIYFLLSVESARLSGFTLVVSRLTSADARGGTRVELKLD